MYKVDMKYCLVEEEGIAKVYFMNDTPFTYDTIDATMQEDSSLIEQALHNPTLTVEIIHQKSDYLIKEDIHPLLCNVLLHPESILPDMLK